MADTVLMVYRQLERLVFIDLRRLACFMHLEDMGQLLLPEDTSIHPLTSDRCASPYLPRSM